jgi:hypothetical protein
VRPSPLRRTFALLLRPFTKVHPEETVTVAVMALVSTR